MHFKWNLYNYTSAQPLWCHCCCSRSIFYYCFLVTMIAFPTDDITKPHFPQTIKPNSVRMILYTVDTLRKRYTFRKVLGIAAIVRTIVLCELFCEIFALILFRLFVWYFASSWVKLGGITRPKFPTYSFISFT